MSKLIDIGNIAFKRLTNNFRKMELEEDEDNLWLDLNEENQTSRNRYYFLKNQTPHKSCCMASILNYCVKEKTRYIELMFDEKIVLTEKDYGSFFKVEETEKEIQIQSVNNQKHLIYPYCEITSQIRNCIAEKPCYKISLRIQYIEFENKKTSIVEVD